MGYRVWALGIGLYLVEVGGQFLAKQSPVQPRGISVEDHHKEPLRKFVTLSTDFVPADLSLRLTIFFAAFPQLSLLLA